MKTTKYIIIAVSMFVSLIGYAQQTKVEDPLQTSEMHVNSWAKFIPAVTEDQRKQMVGVENWFITSAKGVRDNNVDSSIVIGKIKKLSEERDSRVKSILSPTQYARYLQIAADAAK